MAEGKKWIITEQGASGKFDGDTLGILWSMVMEEVRQYHSV